MHKKVLTAILVFAVVILIVAIYLEYTTPSAHTFNANNMSRGKIIGVNGEIMNYSTSKKIESYGIVWIRYDVKLTPQFDAYITNLTQDKFQILGILDYETLGVGINASGCIKNCNWSLNEWNDSVLAAVKMYPMIHTWEIWNEPQLQRFQSGFNNGSVYNYFLMLKSAYSIIKTQNSSNTVLCLGGDNIFEGNYTYYDYYWAKQLWSYGASNYCDGISLHAYSGFTLLLNQTIPSTNVTMGELFNYSLQDYENLTKKPIWITETGIPSGMNSSYPNYFGASQKKQEIFLNQSFNSFLSEPYVKGIFWFNLYGNVDEPYDLNFGLFDQNLTPKPAWSAFNKFLNT